MMHAENYVFLTSLYLRVSTVISLVSHEYRDYKYDPTFKNYYKLHDMAMSYGNAFLRCEEEGADLLVPADLDEASIAAGLLRTIPLKYPGAFVGIHSLYSEHTFVTLTGEEVMGSFLEIIWERGDPRGAGRCAALRRSGRLFAHSCEDQLPFICRRDASLPVDAELECHHFDSRWQLESNSQTGKSIDSCYFINQEPLKWREAYMSCVVAGGHLAVINDTSEARFLQGLITRTARALPGDLAFVGFSDLFLRYHYRTVHGDPIDGLYYDKWDRQLPCAGAANSSGLGDKRCGALTRTGLLTTAPCDTPALYICEKPVLASH